MLKSTPGGANGKAISAPSFFAQMAIAPGLTPDSFKAIPIPGTGIPMRDYFAAKAMMAMAVQIETDKDTIPNEKEIQAIAEDAYRVADAMLKAREPEPNTSQFHEDHMKGFSNES